MRDRNKTDLTHRLTDLATAWLDGKGFKPVETEVGVAQGWVADIAGVCVPTQTERIELKLIAPPPRSPSFSARAAVDHEAIIERYNADYRAWRAQYELLPERLTALVEVKTSVGDYRRDRKWAAPWPTNLCFVAKPEGLIPPEDWPAEWGVILCSANGTTIRRVRPSRIHPVTMEQQLEVILNLAVARDHVTRHARFRDLAKTQRVAEGERLTVSRVSSAIQFVQAVIQGRPIEEATSYYGIRARLPQHVLDSLLSLAPRRDRPADEAALTG